MQDKTKPFRLWEINEIKNGKIKNYAGYYAEKRIQLTGRKNMYLIMMLQNNKIKIQIIFKKI